MRDPSAPFYCGCTSSANNIGERANFFDALLWAQRQVGDELFTILYGSLYVANITCGVWKPKSSKGIATLCIDTPKRENERHVKQAFTSSMSKVTPNNVGNDKIEWEKWMALTTTFVPTAPSRETSSTSLDHLAQDDHQRVPPALHSGFTMLE